jgi:hypothetical protein
MIMDLLIVDGTPKPFWQFWKPEPWFQLGAHLNQKSFDAVVFARTPDDVYKALIKHKPDHVQYWGHGAPGRPVVGGKDLVADHPAWKSVKKSVWFRTCLVAQGEKGHAFMNELAALDLDVFAHLAVIGPIHSYLVGVRGGEKAWWSTSLKPKGSSLGAPHTILPIQMDLPSWALEKKL